LIRKKNVVFQTVNQAKPTWCIPSALRHYLTETQRLDANIFKPSILSGVNKPTPPLEFGWDVKNIFTKAQFFFLPRGSLTLGLADVK
jgi:hypothetical protein